MHQPAIRQQRRHSIARQGFVLLAILAMFSATAQTANADHIKGYYPNQGFLWMSSGEAFIGTVDVSSNHCGTWEASAWASVKSTTQGQTYMGSGRWPNGLNMNTTRCDGLQDNTIDIQIFYKDQSYFAGGIGGRNNSYLRSANYCSYWGQGYPCGVYAQVEINNQKFFGASTAYKTRELMHETGHSNNFSGSPHHCNSDSINNDGTSGCNSARWYEVTGYLETDRIGINHTYVP
jgi:hypothetical protein